MNVPTGRLRQVSVYYISSLTHTHTCTCRYAGRYVSTKPWNRTNLVFFVLLNRQSHMRDDQKE